LTESESKNRKSKRERFLTVAERRTVKVLKGVRLLAKCANRSSYEYSTGEVAKIFKAIQDEIDRAQMKFHRDRRVRFSLNNVGVGDEEEEGR